MAKEIKRGQRFYSATMNRYFWFIKKDVRWAWVNGEWVKERLYYFEDAIGCTIEMPEKAFGDLIIK